VAEGSIDDFEYLLNTYHIDTDDGLLYETTRVVEESFPNQGKLLVGYRRRILPNGTPEHEEKDSMHIRNIEEMTNNTDEDILEQIPTLRLILTLNPEQFLNTTERKCSSRCARERTSQDAHYHYQSSPECWSRTGTSAGETEPQHCNTQEH
jgi:hypothetical protein